MSTYGGFAVNQQEDTTPLGPEMTLITGVVLSNGVSAPSAAIKTKRSRNGCVSCKSLRIKCDETKPSCEYCRHTGRNCVYQPQQKNLKPEAEDKELIKARRLATRVLERNIDLTSLSVRRLNSIQKQLNIGLFELKLLYCFREFVDPLTGMVNSKLKNILTILPRRHFASSSLVRNSIYAYTCLNTWPFIQRGSEFISRSDFSVRQVLNSTIVEKIQAGLRRSTTKQISYQALYDNKLAFLEGNEYSLFQLTNHYLMNLVAECNDSLLKIAEKNKERIPLKDGEAEVTLVGIIILYSFLGMHSHGIVPLAKFDENDNYCYDFDQIINLNTDFLTISQNLKSLIDSLSVKPEKVTFMLSKSSGQGRYDATSPIVAKLLKDLELSDIDNPEIQRLLKLNIIKLDECLTLSSQMDYVVPAFKFLLMLDEGLLNLIRTKNYFALRIMNAYSYICHILQFGIFADSNIWIDYMRWFKAYTMKQGGWKYKLDHILSVIVSEDIHGHVASMKEFISSDPEILYNYYFSTHSSTSVEEQVSSSEPSGFSEYENFISNEHDLIIPFEDNLNVVIPQELVEYQKPPTPQTSDIQILEFPEDFDHAFNY